jgi:hypothetical protein
MASSWRCSRCRRRRSRERIVPRGCGGRIGRRPRRQLLGLAKTVEPLRGHEGGQGGEHPAMAAVRAPGAAAGPGRSRRRAPPPRPVRHAPRLPCGVRAGRRRRRPRRPNSAPTWHAATGPAPPHAGRRSGRGAGAGAARCRDHAAVRAQASQGHRRGHGNSRRRRAHGTGGIKHAGRKCRPIYDSR